MNILVPFHCLPFHSIYQLSTEAVRVEEQEIVSESRYGNTLALYESTQAVPYLFYPSGLIMNSISKFGEEFWRRLRVECRCSTD